MVVAAFPLAKIGLLLLKQLSKPVATIIKNRAKKHPLIRKNVIIPTGKAYRWIEDRAAYVKGYTPEPMTQEEAVELGANAIGEIILFGILTVILLAELNRQGDKKAGIQKIKDDEMTNLKDLVLELVSDVSKLEKSVKKIQKDLRIASDVLQLEEASHTAAYDFDFLDAIAHQKRRFLGKAKEDKLDENSPSW